MVSFDVKSLFTNAPSNDLIDIPLRRPYNEKEINTNLTKKGIKRTYSHQRRSLYI